MEEMRVQIEAREPTDGEIRAFWFTLPIDTEQVEELLGIDVDTEGYARYHIRAGRSATGSVATDSFLYFTGTVRSRLSP